MRVGNLSSIRRLPAYLALLRQLRDDGREHVSAAALAERVGLAASIVRKDLEMTGAMGTTGLGFPIAALIADIETFLGLDNPFDAFMVGAGNLGTALLGRRELREHGMNFVAAFDVDEAKVGTTVHGVEVLALDRMVALGQRMHVRLGVVCVPAEEAQGVADMLVDAGVTRIWNFSGGIMNVPPGVTVQQEYLASGLAELLVKSVGL